MKTLNELYPGIGVDTQIKAIKINSKEREQGRLGFRRVGQIQI